MNWSICLSVSYPIQYFIQIAICRTYLFYYQMWKCENVTWTISNLHFNMMSELYRRNNMINLDLYTFSVSPCLSDVKKKFSTWNLGLVLHINLGNINALQLTNFGPSPFSVLIISGHVYLITSRIKSRKRDSDYSFTWCLSCSCNFNFTYLLK